MFEVFCADSTRHRSDFGLNNVDSDKNMCNVPLTKRQSLVRSVVLISFGSSTSSDDCHSMDAVQSRDAECSSGEMHPEILLTEERVTCRVHTHGVLVNVTGLLDRTARRSNTGTQQKGENESE